MLTRAASTSKTGLACAWTGSIERHPTWSASHAGHSPMLGMVSRRDRRSVRAGGPAGRDPNGAARQRADVLFIGAMAVVAVPMLILIVRLWRLGNVYLGDDLALVDVRVRNALHFHELLGPYDRYGWQHPGPAYFYLLSLVHRVVGDGGRTEYIGAALINLAACLGAVWVVRRHAGRWPALWTAVIIGLLVLCETSGIPIGVSLSPWNPYIVVFPLILFGVLCAAGATGSWASLIGAGLVGTFTTQTHISTVPIVAVLLVVSSCSAVIRTRRHSSDLPGRRLVVGAAVIALLWLPPVLQEVANKNGNFTRIWHFFTTHSGHESLTTGLSQVLSTDEYLLGFPHRVEVLPDLSTLHFVVLLGIVLVVGLGSLVLGLRRNVPLATTLGAASLVGLLVSSYAVARIYGPIFTYEVQWEVAVPVLAVIGVGVAIFGSEPGKLMKLALSIASVALLLGFSTQMTRLSLARVSDSDAAGAWNIVAPHLSRKNEDIYLNYQGPSDQYDMLFGLLDQLDARGFRPRVGPQWLHAVGATYVTDHSEPLTIAMFKSQSNIERRAGFVGRIYDVDIVVARRLLSVITVSLPHATFGHPYMGRVKAVDGNPPYTVSVSSSSLPAGLHLNTSTGVISGIPNRDDRAINTFTVRVEDKSTDASQDTATKVLSITIS